MNAGEQHEHVYMDHREGSEASCITEVIIVLNGGSVGPSASRVRDLDRGQSAGSERLRLLTSDRGLRYRLNPFLLRLPPAPAVLAVRHCWHRARWHWRTTRVKKSPRA